MLDLEKLNEMVIDLKILESTLDSCDWQNEDYIAEHNDLEDAILSYLKGVI